MICTLQLTSSTIVKKVKDFILQVDLLFLSLLSSDKLIIKNSEEKIKKKKWEEEHYS